MPALLDPVCIAANDLLDPVCIAVQEALSDLVTKRRAGEAGDAFHPRCHRKSKHW